jgi:hypothetical protein
MDFRSLVVLFSHLNFTLLPQAAILTKHIFDILVI